MYTLSDSIKTSVVAKKKFQLYLGTVIGFQKSYFLRVFSANNVFKSYFRLLKAMCWKKPRQKRILPSENRLRNWGKTYNGDCDFIGKKRASAVFSCFYMEKQLKTAWLDIPIGNFRWGIDWRGHFCKILNSKGWKIDFFLSKLKNPSSKFFFDFSKSVPNRLIFCTRG